MSKAKKTRNANTITEAKYWGMIRSALRKQFQFWRPIQLAKKMARVYISEEAKRTSDKRWGKTRYGYVCSFCAGVFKEKEVAVDHIVPVGSLRQLSDLAGFVDRLTPENPSAYQVICHACHQTKTNMEAAERKSKRTGQQELF